MVVCKLCKDQGHTKISCPYTKALDEANLSQEDAAFWNFIHPADRPESLRGADWSDDEEVMEEGDQSDTESDSNEESSDSEDISSDSDSD